MNRFGAIRVLTKPHQYRMERAVPTPAVLKMAIKGTGEAHKWLLAHVDYQRDDCLKWPFGGDPKSGRVSGDRSVPQWGAYIALD